MSSLEQALVLWRLGLSVIPVPGPRPGAAPGTVGDGKVPAIAWGAYQERLPTEAELRAWFREDNNIAVVTGAVSGVVVIDADSQEALRWCTSRLRYTAWQSKTSRGFHLWYRHPGGKVANKTHKPGELAIDVRGDGGFVIAPGSLHMSGHLYTFAGDWTAPREKLPYFWRGWIERKRSEEPPRPRLPRPRGDVIERARRYLIAIPRPEIGQGSDAATLYAACRLVRGFAVSESEAASLLEEWAGGRPGWTREWIEEKVRNAKNYGSEPVGMLR